MSWNCAKMLSKNVAENGFPLIATLAGKIYWKPTNVGVVHVTPLKTTGGGGPAKVVVVDVVVVEVVVLDVVVVVDDPPTVV